MTVFGSAGESWWEPALEEEQQLRRKLARFKGELEGKVDQLSVLMWVVKERQKAQAAARLLSWQKNVGAAAHPQGVWRAQVIQFQGGQVWRWACRVGSAWGASEKLY